MSAYNLPDYRAKYFEHKDLSKIYGQPTIDSIVTLLNEEKGNAQSVSTTLGGGQFVYLWFFLTDADYNRIPGSAPFIRSVNPVTFTPKKNIGTVTRKRGGLPFR